MTTSPDIEKLFLEYIVKMGETPGGYSGLLKLEDLEKGDSKILGEEMQQEADILEKGIDYMDFEPWELERGKTGARLKEAVEIYRKMGEKMEQMDEKEPKEYHLYLIAILIDIISGLLNHIQIHMVERHE